MIAPADFAHLQALLKARSGFALGADKSYLVASRLAPVARTHGFRGVIDLLASLRQSPREEIVASIVEAMATHETSFFRDSGPYQRLATQLLPELVRTRAARKTVSIWSAACSSGQEPYSIAMAILESDIYRSDWRFRIVATDFSNAVIEKAKRGVYSAFEVQRGLSEERLARHFVREDNAWSIGPALREMVEFRTHNLLDDPRALGAFDIVLCRNALIYFDALTKVRILNAIANLLPSDGALMLGSAETMLGLSTGFATLPDQHGIYRLAATAPVRAAI
jgi:chemotaxis protein methyltransferase CheR